MSNHNNRARPDLDRFNPSLQTPNNNIQPPHNQSASPALRLNTSKLPQPQQHSRHQPTNFNLRADSEKVNSNSPYGSLHALPHSPIPPQSHSTGAKHQPAHPASPFSPFIHPSSRRDHPPSSTTSQSHFAPHLSKSSAHQSNHNPTPNMTDADLPPHLSDVDRSNRDEGAENLEISRQLTELDHVAVTLRHQIQESLLHNADRNQLYLCELLVNLQTARICDAYLYAFCYYKLGDYLMAINILRRYNLIFDLLTILSLLPLFDQRSQQLLNTSMGSLHIVYNIDMTQFLSLHDILLCVLLYTRCLFELKKVSDLLQVIGPGVQIQQSVPHTTYSLYEELQIYSISTWSQAKTPSYIVEVEQIWLMLYQLWYSKQSDQEILSQTFLQPLFDAFSTPLGFSQTTSPITGLDEEQYNTSYHDSISNDQQHRYTINSSVIHTSPLQPTSWRTTISQFSYYRAKIASLLQHDSKLTCYYLSKTFFFDITHLESFKTLIDCEFLPSTILELFLLCVRSHYDIRNKLCPIFFPSAQIRTILKTGGLTAFYQQNQEKLGKELGYPYFNTPIPLTLHFTPNEIEQVSELIGQVHSALSLTKQPTLTSLSQPNPVPALKPNALSSKFISITHPVNRFNTSWIDSVCMSIIRSKSYLDIDAVQANLTKIDDFLAKKSTQLIPLQTTSPSDSQHQSQSSKAKLEQLHQTQKLLQTSIPSHLLASSSFKYMRPTQQQPPAQLNNQRSNSTMMTSLPAYGILHYMSDLESTHTGTCGLANSPLILTTLAETFYRQKKINDCYTLAKHIIYDLDASVFQQMLLQFPQYQRYITQSLPINLLYPNCAELFALCCWELNKIDELHTLCTTLTELLPNNATLWYCLSIYYLATSQLQQAETILESSPILGLNSGVNTTFISNQLRTQRLLVFYYSIHQHFDTATAIAKRIISYFPLTSWEHNYITKHFLYTLYNKQIAFKSPLNVHGQNQTGQAMTESNNVILKHAYFNEVSILQLFALQLCPCFNEILSNLTQYVQLNKSELQNEHMLVKNAKNPNAMTTTTANKLGTHTNILSNTYQSFTQNILQNETINAGGTGGSATSDIDAVLTLLQHCGEQQLNPIQHYHKPYAKLICTCNSSILNRLELFLAQSNMESVLFHQFFHTPRAHPNLSTFNQMTDSPTTTSQTTPVSTLYPTAQTQQSCASNQLAQSDIHLISSLDTSLFYLLGMSFYQQGCISAALYYFKMALLIYQIGHQLSQCPTITLQNATILHRTAKSPIPNKQLPPPTTTSSPTTPSSLAYQHIVSALSSTSSLHNDQSNATTIDSIHKQALGAIEMIETTYYLLPTISTSASGGSNNNNEEYQSLLLNIAHCYRKLKQFNHSLIYYSLCLHISSTQLVTFECYTGLGMCYHLLANIMNARQMYILALSIQPENALINQLMTALSYTIALNTTSSAVSNIDTTISNGGGPKPQA